MTSTEIPIWVSGKQLWISGVDRKTTVSDVVETLLGHPDKQYSIMEKWRRVERPLNGETRILKLWKTWGDAKTEVKLSLKKVPFENDNGKTSPTSNGRRKHKYRSSCGKYGQTIHPKRLAQLSKTQSIEKLLKVILAQGETIQNQILRLKERDIQIEELEGEQHKNRINVLGTNYLLDTYLGYEEKEDSGVATECIPSSENTGSPTGDDSKDEEITIEEDLEAEIQELRDRTRLLEKIAKINKKLEKEEENLVRLFINIERCKKSDHMIDELQSNLEKLKNENAKGETEFENNSKLITDLENIIKSRKYYLKQLQEEVQDEVSLGDSKNIRRNDFSLNTVQTDTIFNPVTELNQDFYSLPNYALMKPVLNTLV